jgi:hypothetical protein
VRLKKRKQHLYATLREERRRKGGDRMLKTRGGGGRREHRDLKKVRRFCQKISGLETRKLREDIVKQLRELAEEAYQSDMDRRLRGGQPG